MFRKWLSEHAVESYDYSGVLFEKASNRSFWEAVYSEEYVREAESYLGYEWPLIRARDYIAFQKEGNRLQQEIPHFAKRKALLSLLMGEVLEYQGRFIADIADGLFNICEETFWGVSAHMIMLDMSRQLPDVQDPCLDLFAAETGALVALTLYLLEDSLRDYCPELVERVRQELQHRIVDLYLNSKAFWWMGYERETVNNWNPWVLSNVLTVFLTTQERTEDFYRGIRKMLFEIEKIYTSFPDDGGCDEGTSYWGVCGGTIYEFCEQLYLATGGAINFFPDEKIRNIGRYQYRAYIGNNKFVNFADGGSKGDAAWKSILYGYGKRIEDPVLSGLAGEALGERNAKVPANRGTYAKRALWNLIYRSEIENQPRQELPETTLLPDVENAFVRSGKWYFAAKGGHNDESHNHNDVGSFIAYYDTEPVLVDPGCGVYTKKTFSPQRYEIWTMRSEWHNLPVVNGQQQPYGQKYRSGGFLLEGKTCKVRFEGAYPPEAGLEKLERTLSLGENGLELTDSFRFDADSNAVQAHFVTPLEVRVCENGVLLGEMYRLQPDCEGEFRVEKQEFFGDEKLNATWGQDWLNRIVFTISAGQQETVKFRLMKQA